MRLTGADVTVVGGGPAGSVSALLLARMGVRVHLVHHRIERALLGEGLPPAARPVLDRLGIAVAGRAHRRSPGIVSCWGSDLPTETTFVGSPFGAGWHLDREQFDAELRDAAVDAGVIVAGTSGGARGPIVLDCTGRASAVARARGAVVDRADRLVSVVGLLTARPGDNDARTFVAATLGGWWYSSLLPDGRRVCGFQTDRDLLDGDRARDPGRWLTQLYRVPVVGELVGDARPSGPLRLVAADSRRLCWPTVASDLLAVGDADMAFDPLSSLGIMAAMLSAEEVVPVVLARLGGDHAALEEAIHARALARERRWTRYGSDLAEHYRSERRWPDAPFWSRRHRP